MEHEIGKFKPIYSPEKFHHHHQRPNKVDVQKLYKTYGIDPDHELLLWEKWIQIRREETENLGNVLMRPPADLVMNLVENIREDKERKTALEYAQIPKKPYLRNHIWEQPERLKQTCWCEPVYELHRKPEDMGRPPIVEHIGVPEFIQVTEKGLTGVPEREPCVQLEADYVKYRNRREYELKTKLKRVDPYKPQIDELLVIGRKPKPTAKKMPPLPLIAITSAGEQCTADVLSGVYALKINKTVVLKNILDQNLNHLRKLQKESWHEFCFSWNYYFNVNARKIGRCKLYLENLGTVTLRYCWKKIKRSIPFIPEDIHEQVFYFNKNEDVLSPGQKKELYFTFVSDKPGIYAESWELSFCNICFFDTLSDRLIINLSADPVEKVKSNTRKIERKRSYIFGKVIYDIAKELLDEIVTNSTAVQPQIYPYKKLFLEAEMFVMKNPVCFYQQTEVNKMKDLYAEMVPGVTWDLSITSWREAMLEKEFDERMRLFDLLKKSQAILLKPWYEGDTLLEEKYRAVKLLLGQMFDKFYDEMEHISEFNGNVKQRATDDEFTVKSPVPLTRLTPYTIHHLFYIHIYELVATTVELCAGVLSSLDLNRWIEFDFCHW